MSQVVKQVKETLQIPCIHNKSGTGAAATVNNVQMLLYIIKTEQGKLAYHYSPACKNYKLSKERGKYICRTALGDADSACQLEELLNDALEREGLLYSPAEQAG